MRVKTPLDAVIQICAERAALAQLYDFYWQRILDHDNKDCEFEYARLAELEVRHKVAELHFKSVSQFGVRAFANSTKLTVLSCSPSK